MVNDGPDDLTLSAQKSDAIVDEENSINLLSQKMRHSDAKMRHSHQVALVDGGGCRKQSTPPIKWKRVEALALRKRKQGIDYRAILKLADNPKFTVKQAQKVLRNYKDRGKLHTCKRRNPQKYYPTDADAKLAALESDKNSKKMRHSDPTGGTARRQDKNVTAPSSLTAPNSIAAYRSAAVALPTTTNPPVLTTPAITHAAALPNSDWLDYQRANSLYDRLLAFEGVALSIHNIHLDFFVPKECYRLLDSPGVTIDSNKGKTLSRTIEKDRKVTYKLYPDGRALVYIKCSGAPFPIVTDSDVTKLIRFMEKAHYILSLHLQDTTNSRYIPEIDEWRLTQADISKDIPVDEMAMHIEPSMQLQIFEATLRLYVRRIGGKPFMRAEEMRIFKDRLFSVIAGLRHGVR